MAPTVLLDAWAAAMWRACWEGGLLVLAVWSVCRLIPSMPARYQCWFWRLAILKFLMVLLCPTLLNLPLLPAPPVAAPVPEVALQFVMDMPEMPVGPVDQVESNPSKPMELPSLSTILAFVWVIGAGWSLAWLLVAWHRARKLQKQSHGIACVSLTEQLTVQGRLFGLRNLPRLVEVKGSGSPMLIGTFRPTIVFPTHTLGQLSVSERTMVLGHELAHIRRGDLFWGLIASIVRAVFFFHPLAWWSERQLKLAQEVAADELVIARQHHEPVNYAGLLVSVVGKLGHRPLVSTISVETAGTVQSLTRRLAAMTRIGQTSRRVAVSSGILLGAVVLLGLVPWRLVAAEPKEGEKQPLRPTVEEMRPVGQAKAIAEIEKLGGKVTFDEKSPDKPVIAVHLPNITLDGVAFLPVDVLANLQTLNLGSPVYYGTCSEKAAGEAKGTIQFNCLFVKGKVTDASLEHLKGLTNLYSLSLSNTEVTGTGLGHLQQELNKLQILHLSGTNVTDANLEHLKGLHYLQRLDLIRTNVTGAGLEHLKGFPLLRTLDLQSSKVTDTGLEHLAGLTKLQSLNLMNTNVTDAGLKYLQGLTNLQMLFLMRTKVTDEGVKRLRQALPNCKIEDGNGPSTRTFFTPIQLLPAGTKLSGPSDRSSPATDITKRASGWAEVNPEQAKVVAEIVKLGGNVIVDETSRGKAVLGVELRGTKLTDAGLDHLKGLTNVALLNLEGTQVTDAGLEHLQGLTKLQWLVLGRTQVTDAGLEHLKGLTKLQLLNLWGTKVTDAGLAHLKGLTNLQDLDLQKTEVTDAGLGHLKGLTKLQGLSLQDTKVTDEGVKNLRHELPNCKIEHGNAPSQHQVPAPGTKASSPSDRSSPATGIAKRASGSAAEATPEWAKVVAEIEKLGGRLIFEGNSRGKAVLGVQLNGTEVTNAGLENVKGLTQLKFLDLSGTKVTDAGLADLKELTNLNSLDLAGTNVTDKGLGHLKELSSLVVLGLGNTEVTDAGLEHLKGSKLLRLTLSDTKVTDAGLEHLKRLTKLKWLILDGTKVTDAGVKKFQQALPNCKIEHGNAPSQHQVPAPGTKSSGPSDRSSPATDIAKRASGGAAEANPEQAKAVAEIKKLGGKVTVDKGFVTTVNLANRQITDTGLEHLKGLLHLQSLDLMFTKVTDAGLEHLKGLTHLRWLNLSRTQITNAGLEHLKALTQLQSLSLTGTKVTDAGLEYLKGRTQLQSLGLNRTKVTDAGLEHLKGLTQLQQLYLADTKVSNAGLEHVKGFPQLQNLGLMGTKVTDTGLEHLKGLTQVHWLDVRNTEITDAGLEHLKRLTQLRHLNLSNTKVTNAGLEHLHGLTKLELLRLRDTQVTDEGMKKLQQALPNCEIEL